MKKNDHHSYQLEHSCDSILIRLRSEHEKIVTIHVNVDATQDTSNCRDMTHVEDDEVSLNMRNKNRGFKPEMTPEEKWERQQICTPDQLERGRWNNWSSAVLMYAIKSDPVKFKEWKEEQVEKSNRMKELLEKRRTTKGISIVKESSLVVGEGEIYSRIRGTSLSLSSTVDCSSGRQ